MQATQQLIALLSLLPVGLLPAASQQLIALLIILPVEFTTCSIPTAPTTFDFQKLLEVRWV